MKEKKLRKSIKRVEEEAVLEFGILETTKFYKAKDKLVLGRQRLSVDTSWAPVGAKKFQ